MTKITFEEGCFDHMEIESQEELDKITQYITAMFQNPELIEANSRELSDEEYDQIMQNIKPNRRN